MKGDKYLSVKEVELSDFKYIVDYFLTADKKFLEGMGVDISKLPERNK